MGFANAGFFDDIGNGIAGAANDVADFTVDAAIFLQLSTLISPSLC
jgi:hypothetical protein